MSSTRPPQPNAAFATLRSFVRNRAPAERCELCSTALRRLREQNGDLFPAIPCAQIDRANSVCEDLGDVLENEIASLVSSSVVDRLEVVEIDEDQRARSAEPVCLSDDALKLFVEMSTVR